MKEEISCLVRHLNSYHALDAGDRALLRGLEGAPEEVTKGTPLWQELDEAQYFYVLQAGWAYSYRYLADGGRQVLEFYMPGDLIGLRDFAFRKRRTGIVMLKDGVVCPFPLKELITVFCASKVLSGLFFAVASREQTLLVERLVNLGRRTAAERMANLIAEIYVRLQRTNPDLGESIPFPVSQELLGDALGLSAVHVSRTFRVLREEGLLDRQHFEVSIPDFERLADYGGFASQYLHWKVRDLVSEVADHGEAAREA